MNSKKQIQKVNSKKITIFYLVLVCLNWINNIIVLININNKINSNSILLIKSL